MTARVGGGSGESRKGAAGPVSRSVSQSEFALRFFAVAGVALSCSGLLAAAVIRLAPPSAAPASLQFPPTFAASTAALFCGSWWLARALHFVRRERQPAFRRSLVGALVAGTAFVGLQTAALNWMLRRQAPEDVQTGVTAFVAVASALHGMHFLVALLCLAFVTVRAFADRYDHEYYWGVTVCGWFWHALGVAWIAVLGVMLIAR